MFTADASSSSPQPRQSRIPGRRQLLAALAALAVGSTALTACSTGTNTGESSDGSGPKVVASTNVWGDIARTVAGDKAQVSSIVNDPTADPHSFEASPADAAKITSADLVVFNGAGYDAFITQALASSSKKVTTVEAVTHFTETTGTTIEPHDHSDDDHNDGAKNDPKDNHGDDANHEADNHDHAPAAQNATPNEHVWYSLPTAVAVAADIAEKLAALNPAEASLYRENAKTFAGKITPLNSELSAIGETTHVHYVQAEPVGQYLFDEADFHDDTPRGLLKAAESGSDPAASDVAAALAALKSGKVGLLVVNSQTSTSVSDRLREAAKSEGVPVLTLSETLPPGANYESWMRDQVRELNTVLTITRPAS